MSAIPLKSRIGLLVTLILAAFFVPGVFAVRGLIANQHISEQVYAYSHTIETLMEVQSLYASGVYDSVRGVVLKKLSFSEAYKKTEEAQASIRKSFAGYENGPLLFQKDADLMLLKSIEQTVEKSIGEILGILKKEDSAHLAAFAGHSLDTHVFLISTSTASAIKTHTDVLMKLSRLSMAKMSVSIKVLIIAQIAGILVAVLLSFFTLRGISSSRQ